MDPLKIVPIFLKTKWAWTKPIQVYGQADVNRAVSVYTCLFLGPEWGKKRKSEFFFFLFMDLKSQTPIIRILTLAVRPPTLQGCIAYLVYRLESPFILPLLDIPALLSSDMWVLSFLVMWPAPSSKVHLLSIVTARQLHVTYFKTGLKVEDSSVVARL